MTLNNWIVTSEILIKYQGTQRYLEDLNMNCCKQLTDNGLLLILQLCGSTLRYLNISGTEETEENMK